MTAQPRRASPLITQSVIFEAPLTRYVNPDPPQGCAFRWFRDSDAPTMASYGYPRSYINDRLKKGARIVVAEFEGRAVGWKMLQTGEVDQLSWLRMLVPPDMVFGLTEFVVPEMRGTRVPHSMHEFAIAPYATEGYQRLGCNCETWNTFQMRRIRRDFSEIMTATRRNYLLFHTAEVNGQTHVGLWGQLNRFVVAIP